MIYQLDLFSYTFILKIESPITGKRLIPKIFVAVGVCGMGNERPLTADLFCGSIKSADNKYFPFYPANEVGITAHKLGRYELPNRTINLANSFKY